MANIIVKDIDGRHRIVSPEEMGEAIVKNAGTIYGMSMDAILAFRRVYLEANMPLEITAGTVNEFFKKKGVM